MTVLFDAGSLSLEDVQSIFKFVETLNNSFSSLLAIENITESEQHKLEEIRNLVRSYYAAGKISEGLIKFLFIAPLMNLAGFYIPNIKITLEEKIADIFIEDEDTFIKGRMDILAVNKQQGRSETIPFWILVIETKNSSVNASVGLPQLLTYAYKGIEQQSSVWGLTTNGMDYQFVYIQQGIPIYQLLPKLDMTRPESSVELLQVLKAIRKHFFDN